MEEITNVNVKYIEQLDDVVKEALQKVEDTELVKYKELHGKQYKGLIFQHQKDVRSGDRLRVYAGDKGKKRYYSTKRYTPMKELFALCDSILKGER